MFSDSYMVPAKLMTVLLLNLPVKTAGKERIFFSFEDSTHVLPWPKDSADDEVACHGSRHCWDGRTHEIVVILQMACLSHFIPRFILPSDLT